MRYFGIFAAALVAASLTAGNVAAQDVSAASAAEAAPDSASEEIVVAQARGRIRHVGTHVYLLRGFMDIFSTGMDDLGVKLNRRGIRASVHGHAEYQSLADGIIRRYRAGQRENVVIIGHSLGANAAFSMAEVLGERGINVPLIISYDPTASMAVSRNVSRVVNFYSSTNGWGTAVVRGSGFRGSLSNIDLSRRGEMGHTDIDKSPSLHNQSIAYIQSIGGGSRSSSTSEKPKPAEKDKEGKNDDTTKAAAKDGDADSGKPKVSAAAAASSGSSVPGPSATTAASSGSSVPGPSATVGTKDSASTTAAVSKPEEKPAAEKKPAGENKPTVEKTAASPSPSTSN